MAHSLGGCTSIGHASRGQARHSLLIAGSTVCRPCRYLCSRLHCHGGRRLGRRQGRHLHHRPQSRPHHRHRSIPWGCLANRRLLRPSHLLRSFHRRAARHPLSLRRPFHLPHHLPHHLLGRSVQTALPPHALAYGPRCTLSPGGLRSCSLTSALFPRVNARARASTPRHTLLRTPLARQRRTHQKAQRRRHAIFLRARRSS